MDEIWIPPHTKQAIDDYVQKGLPPGGFVSAVLENDLANAIGRADVVNKQFIAQIVAYVHLEIPAACHGSIGAVTTWIEKGGLGAA